MGKYGTEENPNQTPKPITILNYLKTQHPEPWGASAQACNAQPWGLWSVFKTNALNLSCTNLKRVSSVVLCYQSQHM